MTLYWPIAVADIVHYCMPYESNTVCLFLAGSPKALPTHEGLQLSGVLADELFLRNPSGTRYDGAAPVNWNCLTLRFVDEKQSSVFADLVKRDHPSSDDVPTGFLQRCCVCRDMKEEFAYAGPDGLFGIREFHYVNSFIGGCISSCNCERYLIHHEFAMGARVSSCSGVSSHYVEDWVRDASGSVLYRTSGGERAYVLGEYFGIVPASREDFSSARGPSGFVVEIGLDHFDGFREHCVDRDDLGMAVREEQDGV